MGKVGRLWIGRVVVALLLVALVAPAMRGGVVGAQEVAWESVKKSTTTLPKATVAWQASVLPTVNQDATPMPFGTGFLYAGADTLVVTKSGSERTTRLRPGTALAVVAGTRLAPVAFTGDETEFLALELLPEEDAAEAAGDGFELAKGRYTIELLRAELPAAGDEGEGTVSLDATELPTLVVVVSGAVELTVGSDEPEELEAEDGRAVTDGFVAARSGDEAAVVLAVTIREASETGSTANSGGSTGSGASSGEAASGGAPSGGQGSPQEPPSNPDAGGGEAPPQQPEEEPEPEPDLSELDSDGDGLSDKGEIDQYGTDPNNPDTDGDGLSDFNEALHTETDPLNPDTDGDTLSDGDELNNPNIITSALMADTDGDGLQDGNELRGDFGPPTNPVFPDTDNDGVSDGDEIFNFGSNPLSTDTDGDGFSDGAEVTAGTGPANFNDHP